MHQDAIDVDDRIPRLPVACPVGVATLRRPSFSLLHAGWCEIVGVKRVRMARTGYIGYDRSSPPFSYSPTALMVVSSDPLWRSVRKDHWSV